MHPEHDLHKMVGRKLTKERRPLRASSVQYPARLKEGEDAQDDVTAAKGESAQDMNQSLFSMITAAGSKVDFNARFEEQESSDSDDENEASAIPGGVDEQSSHPQSQLDTKHQDAVLGGNFGRVQGISVQHRGLRTLPKVDLRTAEEKSHMSRSLRLPSCEELNQLESPTGVTPRDAPVMSMMLEARAELVSSTPLLDVKNTGAEDGQDVPRAQVPISLVTRLMEIFGFERPEEVISGD